MSLATKTATLWKTVRHVKNWPEVVRRQFLARTPGTCPVVLRNGLHIVYRSETEDWETVKEVIHDGVYEYTLRYLQAQRGKLPVFDFGANIGLFSLRAAQCSPGSAVYAYEPAPKNAALIRENLALNPALANRIQVRAEAVGGHTRQASFFFDEQATQASKLADRPDAASGMLVPVRALAEILREVPGEWALAKIDIEGAEYELFRETPPEAWSQVRALSIEIHSDPAGREQPAGLLQAIEALGFIRVKEFSGQHSYFFHREAGKPAHGKAVA
jgi:FkbM family methyltransferase